MPPCTRRSLMPPCTRRSLMPPCTRRSLMPPCTRRSLMPPCTRRSLMPPCTRRSLMPPCTRKPYATLIDRRAEVALGERGLRFQRLAPARAGFFRLAVGFQNAAQIEQRLGHVGYLREGIAILADRLVELARFFVHQAGVVEHLRRALAQIDQAHVELQRGIEIVGLDG